MPNCRSDVNYKEYPNREEWLKARLRGIGASEMAAALGLSSFMSRMDLWKLKTGKAVQTDLADNERVQYGTEAEQYLRELFSLKHKDEYKVEYHPFRIYTGINHMFATLDGELTRLSDNAKGIWECKTTAVQSMRQLELWNDRVPDHYYVQILSQLSVTGYQFAILNAEIGLPDGTYSLREYYFDRDSAQEDIEYVEEQAKEFWQTVKTKKMPSSNLTL